MADYQRNLNPNNVNRLILVVGVFLVGISIAYVVSNHDSSHDRGDFSDLYDDSSETDSFSSSVRSSRSQRSTRSRTDEDYSSGGRDQADRTISKAKAKLRRRLYDLYPKDQVNSSHLIQRQDFDQWVKTITSASRLYTNATSRVHFSRDWDNEFDEERAFASSWFAHQENANDLVAFIEVAIEQGRGSEAHDDPRGINPEYENVRKEFLERYRAVLLVATILTLDSNPGPCEELARNLRQSKRMSSRRNWVEDWYDYVKDYYQAQANGTFPPQDMFRYNRIEDLFEQAGLSSFGDSWKEAIERHYESAAKSP